MKNAFNEQRQSISKRNGKFPIKLVKTRKNPLRSGNHRLERGFYGDYFEKRERGARYLDAKTSRWLSTDPALGEYIPGAPINDEVKKANQNLPGMGGVFNVVNMHLYHYAGNNPVKYTDPTGMSVIIFAGGDERFMKAIDFLYGKSETFKKNMDKLFSSTNANGEKLLVQIKTGSLPSDKKGQMLTSNVTVGADELTQSIDSDGNIVDSTIKEGENAQYISITIDMEKNDDMLSLFGAISEEVMHAADAADLGAEGFNNRLSDEQKNYSYSEQPLEVSAKERTWTVLEEAYE